MKIVEPPAAMIDWAMFSRLVNERWPTQYAFNKGFGFGGATRNAAWHGKPIGVVPLLRICKAMNLNPTAFLVQR